MRKLFVLFAMSIAVIGSYCSFTACSNASAQSSDPYQNEITKMLELTKARETMMTTMVNMWTNMHLPIDDMDELAEAVLDGIWEDYVVDCAAVYRKYFTLDEIKELNKFYESPIGKKISEHNSQIVTECSKVVSDKYTGRIQEIISEHMSR